MKKSPLKRIGAKSLETPHQKEQREALAQFKRNHFKSRKNPFGAVGQYHEGEWVPSKWELHCKQILRAMEDAGRIENLRKEILSYTIYNDADEARVEKIEMDFCFYHKELKRECRWDAKPPKTAHTKRGRNYPQKKHASWFVRYEQLKFCQPDYFYQILEKGKVWIGIDI